MSRAPEFTPEFVHVAGGVYLLAETYVPLSSAAQEWLLEVLNDELHGAICAGRDAKPLARQALSLIAARVEQRLFERGRHAAERKSQGGIQ